MKRLQYSLLAAAGILILALVLTAVGPKRVMAALGFTPVRDVDQPARQPFVHNFDLPLTNGIGEESITVPLGKRLVIETVDAAGFVTPGQKVDFMMDLLTSGSTTHVRHHFPPTFIGTFFNLDRYTLCQSVRLYGEPGSTVRVIMQKNAITAGGVGDLAISGHFVDLP
jgi:hypothetical protein